MTKKLRKKFDVHMYNNSSIEKTDTVFATNFNGVNIKKY